MGLDFPITGPSGASIRTSIDTSRRIHLILGHENDTRDTADTRHIDMVETYIRIVAQTRSWISMPLNLNF